MVLLLRSSRKSFLSVVTSREQGRLYSVVQEPTEDPPHSA